MQRRRILMGLQREGDNTDAASVASTATSIANSGVGGVNNGSSPWLDQWLAITFAGWLLAAAANGAMAVAEAAL